MAEDDHPGAEFGDINDSDEDHDEHEARVAAEDHEVHEANALDSKAGATCYKSQQELPTDQTVFFSHNPCHSALEAFCQPKAC